MTVRDTSALSHAINRHGSKKAAVVDYVSRYGPVTRKQIAVGLGIETSTISGLVTPLVKAGRLFETEKAPCPETGRMAIFVDVAPCQMEIAA